MLGARRYFWRYLQAGFRQPEAERSSKPPFRASKTTLTRSGAMELNFVGAPTWPLGHSDRAALVFNAPITFPYHFEVCVCCVLFDYVGQCSQERRTMPTLSKRTIIPTE